MSDGRDTAHDSRNENVTGEIDKIAVVQLSDIHFKANSNVLIPRSEKVVAAIRPTLENVGAVIFAVTGDVASSGSQDEYHVASKFFASIRNAIQGIDAAMPAHFVFIPGNHDCDFRSVGDARPALLETLPAKIETLDPAGEIVGRVTEVQDNFFAFEGQFQAKAGIPKTDRLKYQTKLRFGRVGFRFDCYNTAWMSQQNEQQGALLFPVRLLASEAINAGAINDDERDDIRISLIHHRDNWLESNNARLLRDHLDVYSDIIFSGHEHVGATYSKTIADGTGPQYIEGAVLQDHKSPGNSGFNVLELDLSKGLRKTSRFRWSGQRYSCEPEGEWTKFERNSSMMRGQFQIAPSFLKVLRDPGVGFIHPGKPDLTLDDLFVYPDLRRMSLQKLVKSNSTAKLVAGRDVVRFVAESKHVMVSGPDDSGRTSLAHMLYLDLRYQERLVPVLLNGSEIHGKSPEAALRRELNRAVTEQYSGEMVEIYNQLDPTRKVLIVDDWHKLKYGQNGQILLLNQAEKSFGYVVCFADDIFALEQFAGGGEKPFRDYELCEIRELGHLRRNELIRKWQSLGTDYSESETDLAHSITAIETTVNTLLGKNLLPSYPVIILAILQSYATQRSANTSAGSYGQMYEALITAALASVSKKAVELGTKYTYISHIAHYVFETNKQELETADLERIRERYYEQYKINLDRDELTDQLVTCQLLSRTNGVVRFKYKYIYCYFVAKYFQDNIANVVGEGDLRRALHDIADKVYFEDYANIIIFYVYLTKDRELIEHVLANATRIYRDQPACDLTSHVEFVNRLGSDAAELILPPTSVAQNRERVLRRKDEAEEEIRAVEKDCGAIKYDDSLADVVRIHIAMKNLRIMGQILRNFPGALKADLKLDLAFASYQLGLRTLRAILLVAETNIEELRVYIARLIHEKRALEDHEELAEETDRVVISLTRNVAFGIVKRISQAVGLEELEETYRSILERDGERLPVKIIDYAIKLDHFSHFPKRELEQIVEASRKNAFASRLVRDLTADYIYLFPADFRVRQYIGDTLRIKVNTPQILGPGPKKMKALN